MDIRSGIQTWTGKPNDSIQHSEHNHANSAVDEAKVLQNGQDLADTLNKVADPNWVDPSKRMRTTGNAELGKDAFMNLLITQMKNQDPTNPLKSHEMAAQLAQFTSLEKLTNIDSGIEKLRADSKPQKNFEVLAMIGKEISTDSSKISRSDLKGVHDLRFRLAADAAKVTINIKNSKGDIVRALNFSNVKEGKNNLSWNGSLEDGSPAPIGEYTMEVNAMGSNGAHILAQAKSEGVITGVNFTGRGPQVLVGKDAIDIADIRTISEPKHDAPSSMAIPPTIPLNQPIGTPVPLSSGGQSTMLSPTPSPMARLGPIATPGAPDLASQEVMSALTSARRPEMRAAMKPESKPINSKKARMANGSVLDATMATSILNQLKKEGVKEGA